ncbi:hypothetical protein BKA70DRAFT_1227856 [Coprinopsis sp. MPI-PUGE-AT-0042]|nr:hypothetical protein BKA70DRAFT_1227856 [Coprinopsis sp. MPI-PUGE-AT-0042]
MLQEHLRFNTFYATGSEPDRPREEPQPFGTTIEENHIPASPSTQMVSETLPWNQRSSRLHRWARAGNDYHPSFNTSGSSDWLTHAPLHAYKELPYTKLGHRFQQICRIALPFDGAPCSKVEQNGHMILGWKHPRGSVTKAIGGKTAGLRYPTLMRYLPDLPPKCRPAPQDLEMLEAIALLHSFCCLSASLLLCRTDDDSGHLTLRQDGGLGDTVDVSWSFDSTTSMPPPGCFEPSRPAASTVTRELDRFSLFWWQSLHRWVIPLPVTTSPTRHRESNHPIDQSQGSQPPSYPGRDLQQGESRNTGLALGLGEVSSFRTNRYSFYGDWEPLQWALVGRSCQSKSRRPSSNTLLPLRDENYAGHIHAKLSSTKAVLGLLKTDQQSPVACQGQSRPPVTSSVVSRGSRQYSSPRLLTLDLCQLQADEVSFYPRNCASKKARDDDAENDAELPPLGGLSLQRTGWFRCYGLRELRREAPGGPGHNSFASRPDKFKFKVKAIRLSMASADALSIRSDSVLAMERDPFRGAKEGRVDSTSTAAATDRGALRVAIFLSTEAANRRQGEVICMSLS